MAGGPATVGHGEGFQGVAIRVVPGKSAAVVGARFVDSLFLVARVGVRRVAVVDSALSHLLELRGVYEEGEVPVAWPAKGVGKRQNGLTA